MGRPTKKSELDKLLEGLPIPARCGRKTLKSGVAFDFNKKLFYVYLGKINGKKKYETFKTSVEVEKFLKDKEAIERKTGKNIAETMDITLKEYMLKFHKNRRYKTETTKRFYDVVTNRLVKCSISDKPMNSITVDNLNDFFNEHLENYSANTVKKDYTFLKTIMTRAFKEGIIVANRMDLIDPIVVPKSNPKSYTKNQIEKLLKFCLENLYNKSPRVGETKYNYCVRTALICMLTGCRREEALGLKFKNVYMDCARPYVLIEDARHNVPEAEENLKTSASFRMIPMNNILKDVLTIFQNDYNRDKQLYGDEFEDEGYVISFENGKPVSASAVSNRYKDAMKGCGLSEKDLTGFHIYRSTFATISRDNNVPHYKIQQLIGHKNFSTTERYYISKQVELPDISLDDMYTPA